MRILAVADVEAQSLYDYYAPGKLDGFDLIIGCGDLREDYLEFLVTMAGCPLVYIHGNHDENHKKAPLGCICIDDDLVVINGLRILGFGGSYRYRDGKYMYSERQMAARIRKVWFKLLRHKGFDILVTHAPARHLGDLETIPHRGFLCFKKLLDKYHPRLFVHGHIHRNYARHIPQRSLYGKTTIINACEYCIIDTDTLE